MTISVAAVVIWLLLISVGSTQTDNAAESASYSELGADSCLVCHQDPETLAIFTHRHGNPNLPGTPFAKGALQCEACHGPSAAHIESLQTGAPQRPLGFRDDRDLAELDRYCLACHATGGSVKHWLSGAHERVGVACADCHTGHDRAASVSLTRAGAINVRCQNCHQSVGADTRKPFGHPLAQGKMACTDCHAAHGSDNDADLIGNTVSDTCFGCHGDVRGPYLWEHEPVAEDCSHCHSTHGSTQPAMLTQRVPFLCQACHSQAGHPSLAQRDTPSRDSALLYGAGCLSCHSQVHGSNHPSGEQLMR